MLNLTKVPFHHLIVPICSDEDILIKSSTATLDSLSTEDLETILPRQPKGKAKTKVAKAKALLRKGIKANIKITFDEEGNVSSNV